MERNFPNSVADGDNQSVTVSLNRVLKEEDGGDAQATNKARCYGPPMNGQVPIKATPCVECGIVIFDSWKGEAADQLVAFVFRQTDPTSKRIGFSVDKAPDDCEGDGWEISGERTIRVKINESFWRDVYGYTIKQSTFGATVHPADEGRN